MRNRKNANRKIVNRLKDWFFHRLSISENGSSDTSRTEFQPPEHMVETDAAGLVQTIDDPGTNPSRSKTINIDKTVFDASAAKEDANSQSEADLSNQTVRSGKTSFESRTVRDDRGSVPVPESHDDRTAQFSSNDGSPVASLPVDSKSHRHTRLESSSFETGNGSGANKTGDPICSESVHVCLKKHAEGGLGAVYLALDQNLQRSVAFKEIKGGHASNREATDRFLFESQVTARLEHPSIVPVYSQGKHGDGRPFYTMRFVNGDTLDLAIKRLHSVRDTLPRQEWIDQLRDLVWRFVSACQAIGYAHSQGFIHRDIKPQNIMLGQFGETLVVDWGLAKCIAPEFTDSELTNTELDHQADEAPPDGEASDSVEPIAAQNSIANVSHPKVTSSPHSIEGRAAGTPSFMSPEQMDGRIDDLDSRSDVFSLGCTLYTIVTGELPFAGKTLGEVSTKVRQNDFRKPRIANPLVPAPLAAICIRAMEHRPKDRYQSVQYLIADIEHWMSDRKVAAYREPLVQRTQRWFRRHKTFATMLAAGLVLTLLITSAALFVVNAEKKEKTLALDRERVAKQQTRAALDTVTDDLLGELMARQESLSETDRQFFDRVLDQYDLLVHSNGGLLEDHSIEATSGRAGGHLQIANLRRRLGEYELAEVGFQTAIKQYRGLQNQITESRFGNSKDLRNRLAEAHGNYGLLLADTGRHKLALENYEEAMRLTLNTKTTLNSKPGAHQQSTVSNDSAKEQIQWCSVASNAANMKWRIGEEESAIDLYKRSIDSLTDIAERSNVAIRRSALLSKMQIRFNYGELLASKPERIDEAKQCLENAVDIWERLSSGDAQGSEAGERLAPANRLAGTATRTGLAKVLLKQRDIDGAIKQLEKTVREQERLVDEYPGFASYQLQLARSRIQLGKCLAAVKDSDAGSRMVESEEMLKLLTLRFPERPNYKVEYANALELVSGTQLAKQSGEVVSRLNESIDIRRSLLESDFSSELYLRGLLKTQLRVANRFRIVADHPSAIASYQDLLETITQRQQQPKAPFLDDVIHKANFGLADSFSKSKRFQNALLLWQKLSSDSEDPNWRHFELQRIICLIRTKQIKEGLAAIERFEASATEENPLLGVNYYDVACCFSIAAELSDSERKHSCQRSIESLREAAELGFFKPESMRAHFSKDNDLLGVSRCKEFMDFLAETELSYQSDLDQR